MKTPQGEPFANFFEGIRWTCADCGATQSLWDVFLPFFVQDHAMISGAVVVGLAEATSATIDMTEEEYVFLELADHGVPQDAVILEIFMTPSTANNPPDQDLKFWASPSLGLQYLTQRQIPHSFGVHSLRGAAEQSAPLAPVPSEVSILVIWQASDTDPERSHLADAAQALTRHDHNAAVLATNVAVEAKLFSVLSNHYSQYKKRKEVENFLTSGATYGHQLIYLWPSLFDAHGAPRFPPELFAHLTRLRRLRNDAAHGRCNAERLEVSQLLLAGLFAFEYLAAYGNLLVKTPSQTPQA